jgi:hypothetical protein
MKKPKGLAQLHKDLKVAEDLLATSIVGSARHTFLTKKVADLRFLISL